MRATKEQKSIINAKKEVFDGYHIPWDESIERKFIAQCSERPNSDPEVILDILTHDIIVAKIESKPAIYYYKLLRKHYPHADAVYEDIIIEICGQDGFESLRKRGFIEYCGILYGRKIYAI